MMINGLFEEISKVAYGLYEKRGREEGNDLFHWLEAEKLVFRDCFLCNLLSAGVTALLEYRPMAAKEISAPRAGARRRPISSGERKRKARGS